MFRHGCLNAARASTNVDASRSTAQRASSARAGDTRRGGTARGAARALPHVRRYCGARRALALLHDGRVLRMPRHHRRRRQSPRLPGARAEGMRIETQQGKREIGR